MNIKLIKNAILVVATATVLTACDDHKNDSAGNFLASEPVTVDGPLEISLTEDQGTIEASLLEGVTNTIEDGVIYARELNYYNLDDNGDPLYQGPALPNGAIRKRDEALIIDTSMWENLLAYQETAVYSFDYLIDNGSDESVLREITVTITGVEDKVEQITISQGAEASVALDYPVALTATVFPSNATFKTLTWASSNTDVATVSANGVVTAVQSGGQATITATSHDGEVSQSIVINTIEEPTEPLSVDIYMSEQIISGGTFDLGEGSQIQLSHLLLPDGLGFDNEVEWTSSNPAAATVSDTGLVTGVSKTEGSAIIKVKVKDSTVEQLVEFNLTDNPNLLYNANWNFESGDISPILVHKPETNTGSATVCAEAAYEGDYGLCLDSSGGKVSLYFPAEAIRQITFERDAIYGFYMMARIEQGAGSGGSVFVSDEATGAEVYSHVSGSTWWWKNAPVGTDTWTQVKVLFQGTELTEKLNDDPQVGDVKIHFELQSPSRVIHVDNIQFIKNP